MKNIVKVLLQEGIDEETIHEVLDVIQEMDNPEKKHELVHNERVRRAKQAAQDEKNANSASHHLGSIKDPEVRGEYSGAASELEKVTHKAYTKRRDADNKLDKADKLIQKHSHKVLGKKAELDPNKQGVTHRELMDFEKEMAKNYGIY